MSPVCVRAPSSNEPSGSTVPLGSAFAPVVGVIAVWFAVFAADMALARPKSPPTSTLRPIA